jgi:ATP-dependent DNA helicase RecQ
MKPAGAPVGAPAAPAADAELLEYMREWRRTVAQRENVAAFVVMHDASLEDLCRKRPRSLRELLQVHGFGEKKTEKYGAAIFAAIGKFEAGARVERRQAPRLSVADQTVQLLAGGKSLEEIAEVRGRRVQTVVEQVADLVEEGRVAYDNGWVPAEIATAIENAARSAAGARLKVIKDSLPGNVTYDQIRLVVARLRFEGILPSVEAVEVPGEEEPAP